MATVQLGSKGVGSIVKLKVNGSNTNFIIVNQSGSQTTLITQNIVNLVDYDAAVSSCASFYNGVDANIRSRIVNSKCFIPTKDQLNGGWSYFNSNSRRIAYYNNFAEIWWTSSFYYEYPRIVMKNGSFDFHDKSFEHGFRPAFTLPSDLLISDDGTVSVNVAPSTPGSISIPSSIDGGSTITISWAASSDANGNLSGYIVERSTDGGGSWSQIYKGGATSTTNNVAFGTGSVMYRVKAYDSYGLTSGYRTSSKVTVFNNVAPTVPSSITVPEKVKGGESLTISWGSSTDSNGNLSGYILERSVNGGSFSQLYKGSALRYTDTITKGWNTVAYRVKAYDSYSAASGYRTSDTRTVINNTAPTITGDGPLGEQNAPFTFTYSVVDVDGNSLTVTEKLDGKTTKTRTGVSSGSSLTFEQGRTEDGFRRILNGDHAITVEVSDGELSASTSATFSKAVHAASVTLTAPLAVEGDITMAVIVVTGSIPADAVFKVEATNNGADPEPVWQDVTTEVLKGLNILFTNKTAAQGAAFNFRVAVSRGPSGEGGYIEAVSGAFQ